MLSASDRFTAAASRSSKMVTGSLQQPAEATYGDEAKFAA
jgi:hypothetical protein